MIENYRPKLEYNLAGGLLLTITEKDFQTLCYGLEQAGYHYACVLPFRAFLEKPLGFPFPKSRGLENLKDCPLTIVHLEEAFVPTKWDFIFPAVIKGLYGQFLNLLKLRKPFQPILQDALFPGKLTCERLFWEIYHQFPETKFISHQINFDFPGDRLLVEINPGIQMSPEQLLQTSQEKGLGLVFDPSHLLMPQRAISAPSAPTRPSLGEWERLFTIFSSQVEVVDINPPRKQDLEDLGKGKGVLKELAQAAKQADGVKFFRVEIPIPLAQQIPGLPHQEGFAYLRHLGEELLKD